MPSTSRGQNADRDLLSAELRGFDVKVSGNVDVPLVSCHHQSLAKVRENLLAAFEFKKDSNMDHTGIERQVTLQHMAASCLNPDTGMLTVMTDLCSQWHFFWFV